MWAQGALSPPQSTGLFPAIAELQTGRNTEGQACGHCSPSDWEPKEARRLAGSPHQHLTKVLFLPVEFCGQCTLAPHLIICAGSICTGVCG